MVFISNKKPPFGGFNILTAVRQAPKPLYPASNDEYYKANKAKDDGD
jgi:hypothetical protein